MATLTASELAELRREMASRTGSIAYTKTIINAALQAIEDTMEATRPTISTAIDTATSPFTFNNAAKKILFAVWARQKFTRENV